MPKVSKAILDQDILELQQKVNKLHQTNKNLQKKNKELNALFDIYFLVSEPFEKENVLDAIKEFFKKRFKLNEFSLLLLSTSGEKLEIASHFGAPLKDGEWIPIDHSNTIGKVLQTGKHAYIQDAAKEKKHDVLGLKGRKSGSIISLPLTPKAQNSIGTINLKRHETKAFTTEEIRIFQAIADCIALELKKTIKMQGAENLAFTDALTGIFNRRYFDQRFNREILRAKRYGRELALLMIDIDHFKSYNDNFGHIMGDEILHFVADTLESNLRRADVLCRYGGEEFAVILPEIKMEQGSQVAEKLRRAVREKTAERFAELKGRPVTISVGVSSFTTTTTAESVLSTADFALYEAKKLGRNQVVQMKSE